MRTAALCGAGIVLQPEMSLAADIKAGRLVHVLPEWSFKPTSMYLIYAQDTRPTAKLRSIIDFLVQRFGINVFSGIQDGEFPSSSVGAEQSL